MPEPGGTSRAHGLASPAPCTVPLLPDDVTVISLEGCVTPGVPLNEGNKVPRMQSRRSAAGARRGGRPCPGWGGTWPLLLDSERPARELITGHGSEQHRGDPFTPQGASRPVAAPWLCPRGGESRGWQGAALKGTKCHRGVPTLKTSSRRPVSKCCHVGHWGFNV